MHEHKNDTTAENKSRLAKKAETGKKRSVENNKIFSSDNSLLGSANGRIGDSSITQSHASTLKRAKGSNFSQAGQFVLQLQKQYGNSYVQRVIDLSRKADSDTSVAPEIEQSIQHARGGGQPLDSKVRTQMESSFGADFRNVRVHTNSQANTLNHELSSRAFTTGKDIFFRQGEYNPGNSDGRALLAHELTHVVQQTGEIRRKMSVGQPGDKYEQEADKIAGSVMQQNRLSLKSEESNNVTKRVHLGSLSLQRREVCDELGGCRSEKEDVDSIFDSSGMTSEPQLKNDTFLSLNPEDIAPKEGMPKPLPSGRVKFFIDATKKRFKEPTAVFAWRGKNITEGVRGPEVNKLYNWKNKQHIAAGMIKGVNTTLKALQKNGILDAELNIKNEVQLKAMLGRLAKAGRTEKYTSKDESAKLLKVAGMFTQRDIELKGFFLKVQRYGVEVETLHNRLRIAKNSLEIFYRKQEVKAAATELATIQAEKAEFEKWIGAALDITTAGLGVWKGVADLRSGASKGTSDEGYITAWSSGAGVVKAISGLVLDAVYEDQINKADNVLKSARRRATASEEKGIIMEIDATISRLKSYSALCRSISEFTEEYLQNKQKVAGEFGSVAAKALREIKDNSTISLKDPYSARTPTSRGNIQRVFANLLQYEAISSLLKGTTWPELEGEIPLSKWMRTDRLLHRGFLKPMAREAAKLRWWKKRMGRVDKLLSIIKATVVAIGKNTESTD